MEIVYPKCPKCKGNKFAYKEVPKADGIESLMNEINQLEEGLNSTSDKEDKTELENYLEKRKKVLHDKLLRPTKRRSFDCFLCKVRGDHRNIWRVIF